MQCQCQTAVTIGRIVIALL